MAWRIFQAGLGPVAVIVERRGRMARAKSGSPFSFPSRLGAGFIWKRVVEAVQIRIHYYLRKFLDERFKDPSYLSIEEWTLDHPSVRVYEVDDHNSEETKELLWRLEPDIGVLTNTRKIKKEVLEIPRYGFFNLHLSSLPQYAGLDSIFWALYHGEKEIGVTVHFAAEEIDRGDIVLQRKIPVSPLDTEESLYEKALWLGTFLMTQALKQIAEDRLPRRPQERGKGSYFSWPSPEERSVFRWREKRQKTLFGSGPDRIRVFHLITRMTRGGAQENTLASVLGLRNKGYEVTLLTGPSWGREGEILSEALGAGLDVLVVPELVRDIDLWKDFWTFVKLFSWLAKGRPAILHTHTSKAGFLGRLPGHLLKIPIVIHTPHGHVFHSYFSPLKEKIFLAIERRVSVWTDRLIALTEKCRKEHLELGVGNPSQWVTIPSGVDEKNFCTLSFPREEVLRLLRIPASRRLVGFVGRLAPVKGAGYLLEALPGILNKIPEAHALFVGDGEERVALEKRAKELGLEDHVTFAGHQNDIVRFMQILDVLVVPSLNEGMGRVIVEGGFLGKAVVGAKVGGIPDLIEDGETGILVECRNPSAITRAVVRLLEDPDLARRLGEQLKARTLNGFTEEQMVEKIHDVYTEELSRTPA